MLLYKRLEIPFRSRYRDFSWCHDICQELDQGGRNVEDYRNFCQRRLQIVYVLRCVVLEHPPRFYTPEKVSQRTGESSTLFMRFNCLLLMTDLGGSKL